MKHLMIAVALAGVAASGSVFAQSNPANSQGNGTAQLASTADPAPAAASTGQWVPPYGQAATPKTRAQVYQELIQAEQDGQLAYLNSTVYAHP
jgi:Domain of unknown function (DUF4148)